MKCLPVPRQIRITLGSSADVTSGLLAYVSARFDAFAVDGIVVRRTLGNKLEISYPGRRGGKFPHFLPIDPGWRREFEATVLATYLREVAAP